MVIARLVRPTLVRQPVCSATSRGRHNNWRGGTLNRAGFGPDPLPNNPPPVIGERNERRAAGAAPSRRRLPASAGAASWPWPAQPASLAAGSAGPPPASEVTDCYFSLGKRNDSEELIRDPVVTSKSQKRYYSLGKSNTFEKVGSGTKFTQC